MHIMCIIGIYQYRYRYRCRSHWFCFSGDPNIAPKLPSIVWRTLYLISIGKYGPPHLKSLKDHKFRQLPMKLGFGHVTQVWPIRWTTPDFQSGAKAAKPLWRLHLTLGSNVMAPSSQGCQQRSPWFSSSVEFRLWC